MWLAPVHRPVGMQDRERRQESKGDGVRARSIEADGEIGGGYRTETFANNYVWARPPSNRAGPT